MIFAIELEKCVADASIYGIVFGKLCHKKKPCPIILFQVDKSLEVGFYHTILPFSLIVYLWMEGGRKSPLDIEEIA